MHKQALPSLLRNTMNKPTADSESGGLIKPSIRDGVID